MQKYEHVDVISALGSVMDINTEHYKSDFQYDREMFLKAAANPDTENTRLLWMSRPSGTWCFKERDVFLKETHAHHTWSYYADTKDSILAYAVEIIGKENGKVIGNLYELDYRQYVKQLKCNALSTASVKLKFEDGAERCYPYEEYNNQWYGLQTKYGKITKTRFEPENEDALCQLMEQAHDERQKYTPAIFKVRIGSKKPSVHKQLEANKDKIKAPTSPKTTRKMKANELEV